MKIDLKIAESSIKSHKWLINKRGTINSKNEKDNKCFQYSIALALKYNKFKKRFAKNTKI